jgi:DNA-binding transcriptional regulator LsrR (DeoR family)
MSQLTSEFEGLLQLIVYLECKIDAVTDILNERGISLPTNEINSKTHRIHAVQGYPKRYRIISMMKDGKFDFS